MIIKTYNKLAETYRSIRSLFTSSVIFSIFYSLIIDSLDTQKISRIPLPEKLYLFISI